jgi:hypothetical protein
MIKWEWEIANKNKREERKKREMRREKFGGRKKQRDLILCQVRTWWKKVKRERVNEWEK